MRAAVGLAKGYRNLGNCGLAVGVQELCSVLDDSAVFLLGAGKEARNVHESYQRDIEGVAEAHEAGCLAGCVYV